ncbi:cytochrome P450 protein [Rutstroemia sp. NJR-2017a BVV2]|nr:cytochrome P450 protein [Rutstroemia sp. NJR-2017a BVV2]
MGIASTALAAALVYTFPQYLTTDRVSRTVLRFLVVDVSLFWLWRMFIYPFFFSPLRNLPGPINYNFIWGNASAQFTKPLSAEIATFVHSIPNDGLLRLRSFGNIERLVPTSPQVLKTILSDNSYDFEKPYGVRKFLTLILGEGPIMSEGSLHKFQRKHLLPAFQVKNIRELYPVFWSKALGLVQGISQEITETSTVEKQNEACVEFNDWATRVTLDVIGMAAMGRDFGALRNPDDPLVRDYNELLEPTIGKGLYFAANIFGPQDLIQKLPIRYSRIIAETTGNLRNFCLEVIQEKRQAVREGKTADGMDILSILVRSNDFSDEDLVDQLLTFLAAGHETTSSALTWAIYLLAIHPEWQAKLREEIHAAIPSPRDPYSPQPDHTIIDSLPLLNATTQETLRLYPTVPLSVRTSTRPTSISLQNSSIALPVPLGTRILISPLAINRSTELWGPKADEWSPERWLQEGQWNTGGAVSNYANMTFFHGERSCIGKGFAMSEFRCLLAGVVGGLEWEMENKEEEVKVGGVVTTKPVGGMRVRMKVVEGW